MDIVLHDICKHFGEKTVIKNLNINIEIGKTTCIMGPSGSGKTTLLNILMGLEQPDSGSIINMLPNKSAVFQEDRLCENFSVFRNIRLICPDDVSDSCILFHLQQIGLDDNAHEPVKNLSGGMKRRVAIVRAVLASYDILFLDEPFKGLDERRKLLTIDYIKENIKNKTVVLVTHDIFEAQLMGAEVINLSMS